MTKHEELSEHELAEKERKQNREMDFKKRRFRRNSSITSFVFLIFICLFYMIGGTFYMDTEQAKSVSEFNGIIITQCAVFASIILGHLGFDYLTKQ